MPKTHEKKVAPQFFNDLLAGRKNSEYRLNDCGYEVGDVLHLREFFPAPKDDSGEKRLSLVHGYTGREIWREITHVLTHEQFEAVPDQWVVLSLRDIDPPLSTDELKSGTRGLVPPSRVLNAALTAISTEELNTVVLVGWSGSDRVQQRFYMASSHDVGESTLLLQRGIKEIVDRVELSEDQESDDAE